MIMAVLRARSSSRRLKGAVGILKLKVVLEKLIQKGLLLGKNNKPSSHYNIIDGDDYEEGYCICSSASSSVPEDVKEGHFAVIAGDGGEEEGPKRFVVPLSCLRDPTFLRMLERAGEEYGFDQDGALTIPCKPSELQNLLLAQQCWQQLEGHVIDKALVKSCC